MWVTAAPGMVERARGSSRRRVGHSAEAQLQNEVVAAPGVTRRGGCLTPSVGLFGGCHCGAGSLQGLLG